MDARTGRPGQLLEDYPNTLGMRRTRLLLYAFEYAVNARQALPFSELVSRPWR
jgi:hypothetical protein